MEGFIADGGGDSPVVKNVWGTKIDGDWDVGDVGRKRSAVVLNSQYVMMCWTKKSWSYKRVRCDVRCAYTHSAETTPVGVESPPVIVKNWVWHLWSLLFPSSVPSMIRIHPLIEMNSPFRSLGCFHLVIHTYSRLLWALVQTCLRRKINPYRDNLCAFTRSLYMTNQVMWL